MVIDMYPLTYLVDVVLIIKTIIQYAVVLFDWLPFQIEENSSSSSTS